MSSWKQRIILMLFFLKHSLPLLDIIGHLEYVVAQLVEALRYKPEGCGFDSRWCNWNFPLT
jgi:hypothetical protein